MYEVYYDSTDNSYLLLEKGSNQFLITSTAILIESFPSTTPDYNEKYNQILKKHNAGMLS